MMYRFTGSQVHKTSAGFNTQFLYSYINQHLYGRGSPVSFVSKFSSWISAVSHHVQDHTPTIQLQLLFSKNQYSLRKICIKLNFGIHLTPIQKSTYIHKIDIRDETFIVRCTSKDLYLIRYKKLCVLFFFLSIFAQNLERKNINRLVQKMGSKRVVRLKWVGERKNTMLGLSKNMRE